MQVALVFQLSVKFLRVFEQVKKLIDMELQLLAESRTRLNGAGVRGSYIGFRRCIIVNIFLINHQDGSNRDIITIFFPLNRRTRVFSGLYASYKYLAWKILPKILIIEK